MQIYDIDTTTREGQLLIITLAKLSTTAEHAGTEVNDLLNKINDERAIMYDGNKDDGGIPWQAKASCHGCTNIDECSECIRNAYFSTPDKLKYKLKDRFKR